MTDNSPLAAFGAGNAAVAAAEAGVAYSAPADVPRPALRGLAQQVHGATTVGILGATGVIAPVVAFAGKHPLAWNLGRGLVSGGVPVAFNLLSLEHRNLSDVWWQIAASTGMWSLWTAVLGRMFRPPANSAVRPVARRDALLQGSMLGFIPGTAMRPIVPLAKAVKTPSELPPPALDRLGSARPAVKAPPPPRTVGGGTYTVRPGDSLWTIAADRLGDPLLWTKIAAANSRLTNPSLIHPGQQIHLPTLRVGAGCH